MASPYYLVPEIIAILNQNGFNEKALNLPSEPGMIERTIERGHKEMKRNAPKNMVLENLVVDIPGRFDKNQDHVTFQFTFVYNHETDKMRIQAIRSVMGEKEAGTLHFVGDSKKLMAAHDIYDKLVQIRAGKALEVLAAISPKPHLQKSHHL
jgi:hypothetical protein